MNTKSIKNKEISKDWWLADADGQVLGRFASKVAQILRGKHKINFTPHMDMGDFVIIVNAEKIKVTGSKYENKKYYSHSLYPGGLKTKTFKELVDKNPERIIEEAVKGMLPKNKLGKAISVSYTHLTLPTT